MFKNIFISHSSQNAWVLEDLLGLIREASPKTEVFCSSEAVISPGGNYKEVIYSRLESADMFVAVLSDEYWKSKYSIMELGAAYQRYCFENEPVSIQPVLVPPLDKGIALANTPLVEMQITDLTSAEAIAMLLKKISGSDGNDTVDRMMLRISQYAAFIKKTTLSKTSFTDGIDFGAYYEEIRDSDIPKERIVNAQKIGEGKYIMDFHLSRLDYIPSFASVAFEYWNKINFQEYLRFDRDAAFTFTVDNSSGSANYIIVEFKFDSNHKVYRAVKKELVSGKNTIQIPLNPMNNDPLKEINQISYVIIPKDLNSLDGDIVIENIRVEFQGKDVF